MTKPEAKNRIKKLKNPDNFYFIRIVKINIGIDKIDCR